MEMMISRHIRDIPDHNALRERDTESRELHLKSNTFDKDSTT